MTAPNTDAFPLVGQDITIPQGSRWTKAFRWSTTDDSGVTLVGVDLTGYKARAQVRDRAQSATVYVTFSSDDTDSDQQGTITVDDTGLITLLLTGNEDAIWTGIRKGVWDLYLWPTPGDDTTKFRFCEGAVVIDQEVTLPVVNP